MAIDLARARILVTNDDGIHAPGIKLLEKIAKGISKDVWVVAPDSEQSAAGHSLTLTVPLRTRKVSSRKFAVNGTPTDSVLLGVRHILKDHPPDLVLSGVNAGGNLGEDITYSGTVAAAMEATLLGIPAIALSQARQNGAKVPWAAASIHAEDIIRRLVKVSWAKNILMNVNFPDSLHGDISGIRIVRQGRRKIGEVLNEGIDPRGHPYIWVGAERDEDPSFPNSDLEAVNNGAIAITPLRVDMTDRPAMNALKKQLDL